jgi:hypothetical protein
MLEEGEMLSAEDMHYIMLAHLYNNNIKQIKIYEPQDKECYEKKIRLITRVGKDAKGQYFSFELVEEEH